MSRGIVVLLALCATRAHALDVAARVRADAQQGRPLVVHAFVPLCDNEFQGIVPVPSRLGNGRDLANNLYWGARYGVRTYFEQAKGWKRVGLPVVRPAGVLERAVFVTETRGSRLFLVADAWEGSRIREAIAAFLEAAAGRAPETVILDREQVRAGGAAHVVVLLGHNGLMDFAPPALASGGAEPARGAIILACASRPYFMDLLVRARANPLLLTTGLMAPEAYSLETALRVWFAKLDLQELRDAVADTYDGYQHCGRTAARRLFTTGP
jgi:hypothetical protein